MAEFGEKVFWYVPAKLRGKMDPKWRQGVFLGRALHGDQNYIGLHDGTVTTARAMVRVIPSARWDVDRINRITGTPQELKLEHDQIESDANPQTCGPAEDGDEARAQASAIRRLRISLKDLGTYK